MVSCLLQEITISTRGRGNRNVDTIPYYVTQYNAGPRPSTSPRVIWYRATSKIFNNVLCLKRIRHFSKYVSHTQILTGSVFILKMSVQYKMINRLHLDLQEFCEYSLPENILTIDYRDGLLYFPLTFSPFNYLM